MGWAWMSSLKQSLDISSLAGLHSVCAGAMVNAALTSPLPSEGAAASLRLNTSQMTSDVQKLDAEEIFY